MTAARKRQPEVTRGVILDAAWEEFSRRGYEGGGLNRLVAAAGMTKGAFFHHFADKEAVAGALLVERIRPAVEEWWMGRLVVGEGGLEALEACVKRSAEEREVRVGDAAVVVGMAGDLAGTEVGGWYAGLVDEWREAVAQALVRGKAQGRVHPSIQPQAEAALLLAAVAGISMMRRVSGVPVAATAWRALAGYLETLRAPV